MTNRPTVSVPAPPVRDGRSARAIRALPQSRERRVANTHLHRPCRACLSRSRGKGASQTHTYTDRVGRASPAAAGGHAKEFQESHKEIKK